MSRRVLAAQVAASAVALLVVYLTLLTPSNEGPLYGVEAPTDGGIHHAKAHEAHPQRSPDASRSGTTPVPAAPAPGPPQPTEAGPVSNGPSEAQYSDTLSELQARLVSG